MTDVIAEKRKTLDNAYRRILRADGSSSQERLRTNFLKLCESYNDYYKSLVSELYLHDDNSAFESRFQTDRVNIERCIRKIPLFCDIVVPHSLGQPIAIVINDSVPSLAVRCKSENNLHKINDSFLEDKANSCEHLPTDSLNSSFESASSHSASVNLCEEERKLVIMDAIGTINLVNSIVRPFTGQFNELSSFLTNIQILESVITAENINIAIQCILGKLSGSAANLVPSTATTFEDIINALQDNITGDPSEVVESRLAALRFDNRNLTSFSTEVEKLSNTLSQAYIQEGIPLKKANNMTINCVIQCCRKSTRNDLIKSVLASSTFETPRAVLSKFVTEIADQNKDKQFLAYNQQRHSQYNQHRNGYNNGRSNNSGDRDYRNSSSRGHGRGGGNGGSWFGPNGGRGRGNRNNHNPNYNNRNAQPNNSQHFNNSNAHVRAIATNSNNEGSPENSQLARWPSQQ